MNPPSRGQVILELYPSGLAVKPPVGVSTRMTESAATAALQTLRQSIASALIELSRLRGTKVNEKTGDNAI